MNVVYLFGAGVNQCLADDEGFRPPMAKNLFRIALNQPNFHVLGHVKDRLFAYIENEWGWTTHRLKNEDFDLEDLFTTLQRQEQDALAKHDFDQARELFVTRSALTAYLACVLNGFSMAIWRSPAIRQLGQLLLSHRSSVLTFNYDCIIEDALRSASGVKVQSNDSENDLSYSHFNWNAPLGYGVRFSQLNLQRAGVSRFASGLDFYSHPDNALYETPILKLHGSINWFTYTPHRALGEIESAIGRPPPPFPEELASGLVMYDHAWFVGQTPMLDGWLLSPVLITPVLHKQGYLEQPVFKGLWGMARTFLGEADRLVIVGYSFPPTDGHARNLLLESFRDRPLRELVVVNPNDGPAREASRLTKSRDLKTYASLEEFLSENAPPPSPPAIDLPAGVAPGRRVRMVMNGVLEFNGVELQDCEMHVLLASINGDGTASVSGILGQQELVVIPAEWIAGLA